MFDRILVPLDGSQESGNIRSWIVGLAAELESAVDLLAIIDPTRLKHADIHPLDELIAEESEFARGYLRTESDWFQERGVTVASHVISGDPAESIIIQAQELDSRLIAMTTRRRSALMRGVLGSVSDRVLHSTGIPIMLARPGDQIGFEDGAGLPRTVIVPLDGSNFSEIAIPFAEAIAKRTSAQLLFVTGVTPNSSYSSYAFSDPAINTDDSGHREKTGAYLDRVTERSIARGLKAARLESHRQAADAIIHEVSKSSDRIVVMTSHGASGIKRWLLGSVADKVIRSSEHPVIVIPPEDQQIAFRGNRTPPRS